MAFIRASARPKSCIRNSSWTSHPTFLKLGRFLALQTLHVMQSVKGTDLEFLSLSFTFKFLRFHRV